MFCLSEIERNFFEKQMINSCLYKLIDDELILVAITDKYLKNFGFDRSKIKYGQALNLSEKIYIEDKVNLKETIKKIIAKNEDLSIKYRIYSNIEKKYVWVNSEISVSKQKEQILVYLSTHKLEFEKGNSKLIKIKGKNLQDNKKIEHIQKRLRMVLSNHGIYYWEYDIYKDIVYFVKNIKLLNNRKDNSNVLVVENFLSYIKSGKSVHPSDINKYIKMLDKIKDKEQHVTFDARISVDSKKFFWARISFFSIFDKEGNIENVICSALDISNYKVEENRYNTLLNAQRDYDMDNYIKEKGLMYLYNLNKNKLVSYFGKSYIFSKVNEKRLDVFWNRAYLRISNKKGKQQFKETFNVYNLMELYSKGINNLSEIIEFYGEKERKWLKVNIELAKHPISGDLMAFHFTQDITEIRDMETLIKIIVSNEFKYVAKIAYKNNECFLIGHDGNKKRGSLKYKQYINLLKIAIKGKDRDLFFHENKLSELVKRFENNKSFTLRYDIEYYGKNGTYLFSYNKSNAENLTFTVACSDITNTIQTQRDLNKKLEDALVVANDANKVKMNFLARMSHDMRTPMNAIIGLSDFGIEESNEKNISMYFNQIKKSSEYLLELLNNILEMQRINTKKLSLKKELVDIDDFVKNIMIIVKPKAYLKNITCSVNIEGNYKKFQYIDKCKLQQILINLLNNAIKYTLDDGSVTWNIEYFEIYGKNYCRHSIIDTGVGISEKFLKKIFEPFEQEENILSKMEEGTGLGLAIAKKLCSVMGGTLEVKSELGKGSTFELIIPVAFSNKNNLEIEKQCFLENINLSGKNILLCEDNKVNVMVVSKILENKNMKVDVALNGKIGLEKFKNSKLGEYDAILMDIRMPELDGINAAKQIRALNKQDAKKIPIIAISANAFVEDIERTLSAGMNDHLSKPINPDVLYKTIAKYT